MTWKALKKYIIIQWNRRRVKFPQWDASRSRRDPRECVRFGLYLRVRFCSSTQHRGVFTYRLRWARKMCTGSLREPWPTPLPPLSTLIEKSDWLTDYWPVAWRPLTPFEARGNCALHWREKEAARTRARKAAPRPGVTARQVRAGMKRTGLRKKIDVKLFVFLNRQSF